MYLRPVILLFVGMVAMFGIFCEPVEDSSTWFSDLMISKLIGFVAMGVLILMKRGNGMVFWKRIQRKVFLGNSL